MTGLQGSCKDEMHTRAPCKPQGSSRCHDQKEQRGHGLDRASIPTGKRKPDYLLNFILLLTS